MKEIKLANNKGVAIVDDEDYEMLNQHYWQSDSFGYAKTGLYIDKQMITKRMQQFLIDKPKGMDIDHIDNDKLNNRKSNLRIVTRSQNMMNRKPKKNGTSKYKGVTWYKGHNSWCAHLGFNKKQYWLGHFKNEIDAAMAYNKKAKELFGEYVMLNKIEGD